MPSTVKVVSDDRRPVSDGRPRRCASTPRRPPTGIPPGRIRRSPAHWWPRLPTVVGSWSPVAPSPDGNGTPRSIPWAVVVRYGRWYLLCHSHRVDATRTYRVDRVLAVSELTQTFTMPDGLDPVVALEENLGAGWDLVTRVVLDAPASEVQPRIRPPMGRLEPLDQGCVLVGTTGNPLMYAQEWLAVGPFAFRVEGGPELGWAVGQVAARFAAAIEPSAPRHRMVDADVDRPQLLLRCPVWESQG